MKKILVSCAAAAIASLATQRSSADPPEGYLDHAGLMRAVQALDDEFASCRLDVIGSSRERRGIFLLTLAANPEQAEHAHTAAADQKPALLITAGLDGRHRLGTETALRVARSLLTDHADLLDDMTVYVVPCVNPDGAERNLPDVNYDHIGNMRIVDEDRDGDADEDGPRDLNGDGYITMMRRLDPPLDDKATHLPDPADPRLLKAPDATKGERPIFSLYVEGLDADDDGVIAEDGPGQVDLDRNFMHRWPEHAMGSGPVQISEPESAALARFVLEHRNIVAAITYGRHDNLINVPDGKGRDISGQGPRDLDADDVNWYKELSKLYKDITGQERAPQEDSAGSFHAWLYAQRGIPSFATVVWGRPDAPKEQQKEQAKDRAGQQQDGPDQASQQATEQNGESSADQQQDTEGIDSAKPRAAEAESSRKQKKDDAPKPADAEAAAWLEYSDRERNGEGFIDWQPFDHPTLGSVEIGGFVPGFRMNPPADQLDALAQKQTEFAVALMNRRPQLRLQGPDVKRLADGLYEVRFGIVNDGYLPTSTSMARKARSILPTIVRISTPVEQIVAGDRVSRAWGIGGSGDRFTQRWILRVEDGAEINIDIVNPQLGDQMVTFIPRDAAADE